jgi:hypothetical protein
MLLENHACLTAVHLQRLAVLEGAVSVDADLAGMRGVHQVQAAQEVDLPAPEAPSKTELALAEVQGGWMQGNKIAELHRYFVQMNHGESFVGFAIKLR